MDFGVGAHFVSRVQTHLQRKRVIVDLPDIP